MEKQLREYLVLITQCVQAMTDAPEPSRIRDLLTFHLAQINAFQHERLIHLIVTLFFAALFFACIVCTRIWPVWPFLAIDVIVLVTLGFYVKHYFFLENTIQKLYPLTETLFRLLRQRDAVTSGPVPLEHGDRSTDSSH